MNINEMDTRKTALLFFDMLNAYYHGSQPEVKERMRPVVANAIRLCDAARQNGIPILYACANHRPDGATDCRAVTDTDMQFKPWPNHEWVPRTPVVTAGSWKAEVIGELKPEPGDTIIPKYRWSAFFQTYLDLALRARNVNTVILSGTTTDVGIAPTMYAARDMDYSVIVVRDASNGSSPERHNFFMDNIFPRMARVRSTDQVLEMIRQATTASSRK
jgi:nicotinamidase-related amidase